MRDVDVEYDLADLLTVFDELAAWTDEERGIYALSRRRDDGIRVQLDFSVYELSAGILVTNGDGISCAQVDLRHCISVKVLDLSRKIVEVLSETAATTQRLRCLLDLDDGPVLAVQQIPRANGSG